MSIPNLRKVHTSLKIGSETITCNLELINYSKDYKDVELTDELRTREEQKFELMKATLKGKLNDIYLPVFERLKGLGTSTEEIRGLMKWALYLEIEKMDDRQKTRKWLYPNETEKTVTMAPVLGIRTEMNRKLSTKEKYRLKRQVDYEARLKQLENPKITNVEMKKHIKGIIKDENYSHSRQPVSVYPMDEKSQIERLVATAAVFQSKENEDKKPNKAIKQELKHFYGKNSHMPADRAQKAIRRRKKIYNERLAEFQKPWYP